MRYLKALVPKLCAAPKICQSVYVVAEFVPPTLICLYPRSSSSSLRPSAAATLGCGCPSASHALSRDPRTRASCSPDSSVRFLFSATHGYEITLSTSCESAPAALLPHLPPPPPLTLLWARANSCSSIRRITPFSLPTLHPTPKISPKTPGLATSRPPIANRPRCAPFLPPPHPPPLILPRASFNYCLIVGRLAPFSPPTLHPNHKISPNLARS